MIVVHEVVPRWIVELMRDIDECVLPSVPLFSLGYRWKRVPFAGRVHRSV